MTGLGYFVLPSAGACTTTAPAARDQFAALLLVDQQVLGPEHPDTLRDRNNLVFWTGEAGDPAAARDQFAGLLPVRERVSGPEHPDTLAARYEPIFLQANFP